MVAGILLAVVLVDCIITWFLLARVKGYRAEVEIMTNNNQAMADALRSAAAALSAGGAQPVQLPSVSPTTGVSDAELAVQAKGILENATPEELAQARAVLEQLGL